MNLETLLSKMNAKIEEVKTIADEKRPHLSEEDKQKLEAILERTEAGVAQAMEKVKETIAESGMDEQVEDFLSKVHDKCENVCDYTIGKINDLKEEIKIEETKEEVKETIEETATSTEEKIKEAEKEIHQSFDDILNSEDVKKIINTTKDMANTLYESMVEFANRPETKEAVKKAKKTTLTLAEKGMVKLREWLKTEDE